MNKHLSWTSAPGIPTAVQLMFFCLKMISNEFNGLRKTFGIKIMIFPGILPLELFTGRFCMFLKLWCVQKPRGFKLHITYANFTCRPQITAKEIYRRKWHAETYNFRCETFENLSFIQGLSLAPSARSFLNFMTACYFPCFHVTYFLSSKRKIPVSVDPVSTVVVLSEWNPQYLRYTTVNFAFNSISFLLNISFVLFDMSTRNICRWDCGMLSKAIFIHSHINFAYKSRFIQLEQHTFYFKINCGMMQCGPLWN